MESPTPPLSWRYENLLSLDNAFVAQARSLVKTRLPNYTEDHCAKLLGGAPHEISSRCALNEDMKLIGVMAFSVGQLDTVEIVAFVSERDGVGIGRFLMESFVTEMKSKHKSSILTYIEPSAFPFFSRFGFSKQVPARSLYERITSKYVAAIFMYRDLLEPLPARSRRHVAAGDRLLIMVDGTMTPRQALVKDIDAETGRVLVHYYFWNARHDEWLFSHSPRVRWDLPLPDEPPKHVGENKATVTQVKELLNVELKKEKRSEIVESNGSWPRGIKKNGSVQVRIEGNWIDATVIQKGPTFLFCEFEYNGSRWQQDFPRESVRLGEGHPSALELLIRKTVVAKRKSQARSPRKAIAKRKAGRPKKQQIELSPPKKKPKTRKRRHQLT